MLLDILIENASELLPMTSSGSTVRGLELVNLPILENYSIGVKGDKIVALGKGGRFLTISPLPVQ